MTALRCACIVLGLCAAACGTDTDTCRVPRDLAGPPPAQATTSDVRTILARDCALGGCHLRAPGAGGLVLDLTSTAWLDAMVGRAAQENPTMDLVAPRDPDHSWLAVKIFGEFCGSTCEQTGGCGGRMPPGAPLSEADRATIVAWIDAGVQ